MELNFEYFERIKNQMERDAIIKITYAMKKFARKRRIKRMEAEARKLAAKTKGGKYGKTFKKAGTVAKAAVTINAGLAKTNTIVKPPTTGPPPLTTN